LSAPRQSKRESATRLSQQQEERELQEAFDRACGALSLGIDHEAWKQAELERLECDVSRNTGDRASPIR
jgi:hypothetical protein